MKLDNIRDIKTMKLLREQTDGKIPFCDKIVCSQPYNTTYLTVNLLNNFDGLLFDYDLIKMI